MANLTLLLENGGGIYSASVGGLIINHESEIQTNFSLEVGVEFTLELPVGRYVVRLSFPSGESISKRVKVTDDARPPLIFKTRESAHEWLGGATFTGDIPQKNHYLSHFSGLHRDAHLLSSGRSDIPENPIMGLKIQDDFSEEYIPENDTDFPGITVANGVWLRLFEYDNEAKKWEIVETPQNIFSSIDTDGIVYSFFVNGRMHKPMCIQIGGINSPWRIMKIPLEEGNILLKQTDENVEEQGGISISFVSRNLRTQSLLSFMNMKDYISLRSFEKEVVRDAERMLRDKIDDPIAATVGGYFLLTNNLFKYLHDWPANLDEWFPELPDGAIINAWQALKTDSIEDKKLYALKRFLEAVKRGLPCFSIGLRLLYDGLDDYFRRREKLDYDSDILLELDCAYPKVSAWVQAADWSKTYTTLFGESVEHCSLEEVKGVPWNQNGIYFLPDVDMPDKLYLYNAVEKLVSYSAPQLTDRKTVVVRCGPKQWEILLDGICIRSHLNDHMAMDEAREMAQQNKPSRLVEFSLDGSVNSIETFEGGDFITRGI